MSFKVKESNEKEAVLEITIAPEEFEKAVQKSYIKNIKHFNIPGFRKGKAPRKFVEKYYGEGVFYEDAVNAIVPDAYEDALTESKLDVVSQPTIDIEKIGAEDGLVFTAKVTLKPVVEIDGYKGIKVSKKEYTVKAEDVQREISTLQERTARVVEVTDRAIENGDIVNIDFEGFCDGVAFEGGKGENYDLTIGSGQFIPGFEEQLIGKNKDEETEVNVTFPEEYHAEELKGKPATFKVKIHKISKKELPELDDEFAKDVSSFDTFDALKKDIEEKLKEQADLRTKSEFENNAIEEVVKLMKADIPDCMIEQKIDTLIQDFEQRLAQQGLSVDKYMEYTGMEKDAFRDQFKERAESQVKTSLALEAIGKKENIEISDAEVEEELKKLAESYKMELDVLKKYINPEELKADMILQKAIDFITENAQMEVVKEKKTASKSTSAKKTVAKKTVKKEEKPEASETTEEKPKRGRKKKEE